MKTLKKFGHTIVMWGCGIILFTAILIAQGCAGSAETRATNALAVTCKAYAETLATLAPLRREGKLSVATVRRVNSINKVTDPICLPGATVDPAKSVGIVERSIQQIKQIRSASS